MAKKIFVFTDGGARGNPGPAGAGVVVKDEKGKIIYRQGKFLGRKTNNEAEYEAVLFALDWLEKNRAFFDEVDFFFDSKLIAEQVQGKWKVKTAHLRPLVAEVQRRVFSLKKVVSFSHLPREENELADEMVNQALDKVVGG